MENIDFKVGDHVILKLNGDVVMEIEEVISDNGIKKAKCFWMNKNHEIQREIFLFTSLEID